MHPEKDNAKTLQDALDEPHLRGGWVKQWNGCWSLPRERFREMMGHPLSEPAAAPRFRRRTMWQRLRAMWTGPGRPTDEAQSDAD